MPSFLLHTTRLRTDAVCPVISTPHVMGIMASNQHHQQHQHGSISTATTALIHDIPPTSAPMASKTITSAVEANDSTMSDDSCDNTTCNDISDSTINNESIASNESTASNDSSDSVASNKSTTSNGSATSSSSNALIAPIKPRCFPIITIQTPAFVAPRRALRYIAAGWRVIFVRPARALAMTASKLFGALVPGHANYRVANVDANGSLRGSVHRYGDLNEADSATTSEVIHEAVGQETIIQETVVQEQETTVQEQDTVIQETITQEQETVIQKTIVQEATVHKAIEDVNPEANIQSVIIKEDTHICTSKSSSIHSASDLGSAESNIMVGPITTTTDEDTNVTTSNCTVPAPCSGGSSNNKLPATEFTFSFPALRNNGQPITTDNELHVSPSVASNSLFGCKKLDAAAFTFMNAGVASTQSPAAGASLPIAMPTAEFTFTAPIVRRNSQCSSNSDIESCWDGIFSSTSRSSESSRSSPAPEDEKNEVLEKSEKNNKKGSKKSCNKKKKEPTNKAAVWGGKKGKKGSNKAKKH